MSEAQLKKILEENDRLKREVEDTKKLLKVSEACKDLIGFVQKTEEPFSPDWTPTQGANPWVSNPKKGPCVVL